MTRVGPKGQVVIPKEMRDALGLEPGDDVDFELTGRAVTVRPRTGEPLKGRFRGSALVEALETDRAAEPR